VTKDTYRYAGNPTVKELVENARKESATSQKIEKFCEVCGEAIARAHNLSKYCHSCGDIKRAEVVKKHFEEKKKFSTFFQNTIDIVA